MRLLVLDDFGGVSEELQESSPVIIDKHVLPLAPVVAFIELVAGFYVVSSDIIIDIFAPEHACWRRPLSVVRGGKQFYR